MLSSVPKPVLTLIIGVVVLALIPTILPMLVSMLLTDFNVVIAQAQRLALPGAMAAGAAAGIVHFSPLHKTHAISLLEGSFVGLAVVALVTALYPWLDAHYAVWVTALRVALGG